MENNGSSTVGGGISFGTLFFLVLFVLKLTNVIDWSWWWVTAPLWAGYAILLIYFIIGLIIAILSDK